MRTCTLSGPNSATKGASREAHDADGVSRVPRSASVRNEILRSGFLDNAARIVDILVVLGWNEHLGTYQTHKFMFCATDIQGR